MEINIPKTSVVMAALLRADLITVWRNRRSVVLVLLLPMIIVFAWGYAPGLNGPFILSSAITLGLVAIGLMGYTNALARDREKGIFQRLRVAPVPSWAIMVSRLIIQLGLILLLTIAVFLAGFYFDHISLTLAGYVVTFFAAIVGGSVYLSLGQAIVGRIKNPETVNSTTRLFYFCFVLVGMLGELLLGKQFKQVVDYTPYGTVKIILAASMQPATWDSHASIALLLTLGYTIVLATLGIKWFKWDTK